MDTQDRWDRQIEGLRQGDGRVIEEFWNQYGPNLLRLAEKNLAENLRRRVGAEDVVQSACRTFLRRARGGEFQLADSESLWRLMCAITLTKIREQARYHSRKKRGLDHEVAMPEGGSGLAAAAPGPTPAEAAQFADQFQQLLGSLDEEERQIVELKLEDLTHEEVAARLGCSERTVRRIIQRVQRRLEEVFRKE